MASARNMAAPMTTPTRALLATKSEATMLLDQDRFVSIRQMLDTKRVANASDRAAGSDWPYDKAILNTAITTIREKTPCIMLRIISLLPNNDSSVARRSRHDILLGGF